MSAGTLHKQIGALHVIVVAQIFTASLKTSRGFPIVINFIVPFFLSRSNNKKICVIEKVNNIAHNMKKIHNNIVLNTLTEDGRFERAKRKIKCNSNLALSVT